MNPTLDKFLGGKQGAIGLAVLATLILVVFRWRWMPFA